MAAANGSSAFEYVEHGLASTNGTAAHPSGAACRA